MVLFFKVLKKLLRTFETYFFWATIFTIFTSWDGNNHGISERLLIVSTGYSSFYIKRRLFPRPADFCYIVHTYFFILGKVLLAPFNKNAVNDVARLTSPSFSGVTCLSLEVLMFRRNVQSFKVKVKSELGETTLATLSGPQGDLWVPLKQSIFLPNNLSYQVTFHKHDQIFMITKIPFRLFWNP